MNEHFLIALNFLLCSVGGFIVVCRLKFISPRTKESIRWHYVMWFTMFSWSGLSWTYGDVPGLSQLGLSAAGVFQLILGSRPWKYGAPDYTVKPNGYGD